MPTDLLSTIRTEIDERLRELRPSIDEYERLLASANALLSTDDLAIGAGSRGRGRPRALDQTQSVVGADAQPDAPTSIGAHPTEDGNGVDAQASARCSNEEDLGEDGSRSKSTVTNGSAAHPDTREQARDAILAALEHGSHTVSELAVVTAIGGPSIATNLRRLVSEGTIIKTQREGKSAWALPRARH